MSGNSRSGKNRSPTIASSHLIELIKPPRQNFLFGEIRPGTDRNLPRKIFSEQLLPLLRPKSGLAGRRLVQGPQTFPQTCLGVGGPSPNFGANRSRTSLSSKKHHFLAPFFVKRTVKSGKEVDSRPPIHPIILLPQGPQLHQISGLHSAERLT